MKLSHEWTRSLVDDLPDPQTCADTLMMAGLPCEHIDDVAGDKVLDVEVTSNRADCLCHLGLARELAALLGKRLRAPTITTHAAREAAPFTVAIESPGLCPHYTARLIRGVKIGPSPAWLGRRLEAVGLRPINNLVDITNYVLFELGQPMHVFDYGRLGGHSVVVRPARDGETLETLDGVVRKLDGSMLVIADAVRPVALAGVMGGQATGVTSQTVDVLLESARFDPMCVRRTARKLAVVSDSSYRFERGIDPTLQARASDRAVQLILELAGGRVAGPLVVAGSEGHKQLRLAVRLRALERLLGVKWPAEQCVAALVRLGMSAKLLGDSILADVPSHRLDVRIEADLVEEIARVIGYEQIPMREDVTVRLPPLDLSRTGTELIRRTLTAAGFFESLTFSFVSDRLAADFTPPDAARLHRVDSAVRRTDAQLRPSILPGLVEAAVHNENVGNGEQWFFEIASVFWIDHAGTSVEQRKLAMLGGESFPQLRAAIELLLRRLDPARAIRIEVADRPGFGKDACGTITWGDALLGHLGRLDRAVCDKAGLRTVRAAAELLFEPILDGIVHVPQVAPLPRFPAVRRDLSLVVSESVLYAQIESLVRSLTLDSLEGLDFVTTYRGKPLEQGTKSVTFTLVFRSATATLQSEQVDAQVKSVVDAAQHRLGATLRA